MAQTDAFAISWLGFSDSTLSTRLVLFTNVACHLTAYKTFDPPVLTETWRAVRGLPMRCVPVWHVNGAKRYYQNEHGDTLIHTIDCGTWGTGTKAYVVMTGKVADVPCRSVSPIIEHTGGPPVLIPFTALPSSMGDLFTDFIPNPPGTPHFECINEDPPDYGATWLRGTQTMGPWPSPGHGELYHFPQYQGVTRYGRIDHITWTAVVKRDRIGHVWNPGHDQSSFLFQIQIGAVPFYFARETINYPYGVWQTFSEQYSINPITHWKWLWYHIEDMQSGMQMREPGYDSYNVQTFCTQLKVVIYYYQVTQ